MYRWRYKPNTCLPQHHHLVGPLVLYRIDREDINIVGKEDIKKYNMYTIYNDPVHAGANDGYFI